jgi:hypothetical protein
LRPSTPRRTLPLLPVLLGTVLANHVYSQSNRPWAPLTSGPFFTGTADANPPQSGYFEPFFFDALSPSLGQTQLVMPQRVSYGIANNLEIDVYAPIDFNSVGPPGTPAGQSASAFGFGNFHLEVKRQFMKDPDTRRFWARPSLAVTFVFFDPTGKYKNLDPSLRGADQFSSGSYEEGLNLLARKRFKPFEIYLQFGDIIQNPTHVQGGYTFNNGLTQVPPDELLRVVDGNLLYYSGAFEHVINSKWGLGYLFEFFGESQNHQNLFYGRADAPAWSFLHLAPEAEVTWPNNKKFGITWGAGMAMPARQNNYIRAVTPMWTVTFYRNGPHGYRGE